MKGLLFSWVMKKNIKQSITRSERQNFVPSRDGFRFGLSNPMGYETTP